MTDTDAALVAEEFVLAMADRFEDDTHLADCFDRLTWDKFMQHASGEKTDDMVQYIIDAVKRYTFRLGYVSSEVTAECRYKYTPEYIT